MKHLVEPIRDKKQIKAVENYLAKKSPRNRLLFVLGCNSGLRVSDILSLDVKDVRNKTHIELNERYGLSKESVILLEQVRTIDKARLREKMGHIDNQTMDMVNKAISVSFGL